MITRRLTLVGTAAFAALGLQDALGKKKKGSKCRTRVRNVCRCPRCPIDLLS
jgi:hypothetical protein